MFSLALGLTVEVAVKHALKSEVTNFCSESQPAYTTILSSMTSLQHADRRASCRTVWAVRRPYGIRNCLHLRLNPERFYKILSRETRHATYDPTHSVETKYTPNNFKEL